MAWMTYSFRLFLWSFAPLLVALGSTVTILIQQEGHTTPEQDETAVLALMLSYGISLVVYVAACIVRSREYYATSGSQFLATLFALFFPFGFFMVPYMGRPRRF